MCSPLVVVVAEIVIADAASVRMRWDSRAAPISLCPFLRFLFASLPENRVFYYCRTYYKAVHVGGGGEWRTCATERRRAKDCVD